MSYVILGIFLIIAVPSEVKKRKYDKQHAEYLIEVETHLGESVTIGKDTVTIVGYDNNNYYLSNGVVANVNYVNRVNKRYHEKQIRNSNR